MEEAFLRALQESPRSRLVPRVRKGMRQSHAERGECAETRYDRRFGQLRYGWQRLGRRWASFRLGGCTWVGPVDRLRSEWRALGDEVAARGTPQLRADLLAELANGIGLDDSPIDRRGRDYLIRLLASRSDHAQLCRLGGIRWWSPLTLLVEAVNDLSDHDDAQIAGLHDFLAERVGDKAPEAEPRLPDVCRALADWLSQQPTTRS